MEHFERFPAPFRTPETIDFTGVSGVSTVGTRLWGFFPSKQIFRKSVSILLAFCEREPSWLCMEAWKELHDLDRSPVYDSVCEKSQALSSPLQ
nr:hypothetical protein [uncultured Oscillibacter sp.]